MFWKLYGNPSQYSTVLYCTLCIQMNNLLQGRPEAILFIWVQSVLLWLPHCFQNINIVLEYGVFRSSTFGGSVCSTEVRSPWRVKVRWTPILYWGGRHLELYPSAANPQPTILWLKWCMAWSRPARSKPLREVSPLFFLFVSVWCFLLIFRDTCILCRSILHPFTFKL